MISVVTTRFRLDTLNGVHQPGDEYKLALYTDPTGINAGLVTYTTTNEVSGPGYTAGGITLTNRVSGTTGLSAWASFDDAIWTASTFVTMAGVIYNATRGNKACVAIDFQNSYNVVNGEFKVKMPPVGETAIIVIGD